MLARVRTLHLRVVSLCYAVALHSLYTQLPGLYGDHGLAPASVALRQMAEAAPESGLWLAWRHPTLLWLQPVSGLSVLACMELLCLLGAGLGLTLAIVPSLATKLPLALLWLVYISLYQVLTNPIIVILVRTLISWSVQVGGTFLHFQWDILLLEAGLLAVLAAPGRCGRQQTSGSQDPVTMFLIRWLLFRMMFASGVVKLTSGCEAWWGLTAMPTHYSSQCLPSPLAWHASLAPAWLHKLSTLATFVIEIPLTFLFFAPTAALRKLTFYCQVCCSSK